MASENGQIHSFPRLLLNPRRTKDKPTEEEQEEWLAQYDPVLPDDAHRVLSHHYHVRYMSSLFMTDATDVHSLSPLNCRLQIYDAYSLLQHYWSPRHSSLHMGSTYSAHV